MSMDRRPILHVHVADGLNGELLVDVDARSVADGLAYYLSSRHIEDTATEASVVAAVKGIGEPGTTKARIVRRSHDPFTGGLVASLDAHVEGDPGAAHYCPGCQAVLEPVPGSR